MDSSARAHKHREIASKGGKPAHVKGTAHEWTAEEVRDAGQKGGIASHRQRPAQVTFRPSPGRALTTADRGHNVARARKPSQKQLK